MYEPCEELPLACFYGLNSINEQNYDQIVVLQKFNLERNIFYRLRISRS